MDSISLYTLPVTEPLSENVLPLKQYNFHEIPLTLFPNQIFGNCENVDSSVQIIFFQSSKVQWLLSIVQESRLDLLIAEIKGFFREIQERKFSFLSSRRIVDTDICLFILAENILIFALFPYF